VELLDHYLTADGWQVSSEPNGRQALERLHKEGFALLILDLQLPGLDGLALCGKLRADPRTRALPVVMLTAKGEESDRIVGLEVGADDYIVKPFSPKELVARVRALFRRRDWDQAGEDTLRFGPLEIDGGRHTVSWDGTSVRLTPKEFALLKALVSARGRVLSRQTLLEQVWGYAYAEGTRTVDVHVRRLREKLPGLAGSILTVKSLGYRMSDGPEE
jgi:DNA-binding response OmpR family regulator